MDMGGTTRKCHFAPNGGVLFNYGSITNTASSLPPSKDAFQFWAEMIKNWLWKISGGGTTL